MENPRILITIRDDQDRLLEELSEKLKVSKASLIRLSLDALLPVLSKLSAASSQKENNKEVKAYLK